MNNIVVSQDALDLYPVPFSPTDYPEEQPTEKEEVLPPSLPIVKAQTTYPCPICGDAYFVGLHVAHGQRGLSVAICLGNPSNHPHLIVFGSTAVSVGDGMTTLTFMD